MKYHLGPVMLIALTGPFTWAWDLPPVSLVECPWLFNRVFITEARWLISVLGLTTRHVHMDSLVFNAMVLLVLWHTVNLSWTGIQAPYPYSCGVVTEIDSLYHAVDPRPCKLCSCHMELGLEAFFMFTWSGIFRSWFVDLGLFDGFTFWPSGLCTLSGYSGALSRVPVGWPISV